MDLREVIGRCDSRKYARLCTHACVRACEITSDVAHAYFGEHSVAMAAGGGWRNKEALLD